MAWELLLTLAAATPLSSYFDLAKLPKPVGTCRTPASDQIVVCSARSKPSERVTDLGSADEPYLPKAELKIGDAKASVENEAADVGGLRSNRVMARVKIPF